MSADNDPGASSKSDKTNSAKEVVEAWLKSNGVSLEFKVAARFLQRLHPGREVDVVVHATKNKYNSTWFTLWLVMECKSSAKVPWVLYRGSSLAQPSPVNSSEEGWLIKTTEGVLLKNIGGLNGYNLLNSATRNYCYFVSSTNKRDQNDNAKNQGREAVLQVLSAVKGVAQDSPISENHRTIAIFVPVIVTGSPLFTVSLMPDGNIKTEETKRELLVGQFDHDGDKPRAVWIIHEDEVDSFAREYADVLEDLDYRT
jgi:hypothetical protein